MRVITENGNGKLPVVIKTWCDDLEDGALKQAVDLANHPAVFHHVALAPDAHMGFGMPIGGIVAMDGYISPNCVGVN